MPASSCSAAMAAVADVRPKKPAVAVRLKSRPAPLAEPLCRAPVEAELRLSPAVLPNRAVAARPSRAVVARAVVVSSSSSVVSAIVAVAAASRAVVPRPIAAVALLLSPLATLRPRRAAPARRRSSAGSRGLDRPHWSGDEDRPVACIDAANCAVHGSMQARRCLGDFCFFRETHSRLESHPRKTTTSKWPGLSERGPASFFDGLFCSIASQESCRSCRC